MVRLRVVLALWCAFSTVGFPAVRAEDAPAPGVEQLKIAGNELPMGWSLAEGLPGASPQIEALVKDPSQGGSLPGPTETAVQALAAPSGKSGAIVYLRYAKPLGGPDRTALTHALWGDDKRAATDRPQHLVFFDANVLVVCFPTESDEAEWIKERLRTKFKAKIARSWKELKPLMGQVMGLVQSGDLDQALSALKSNADRIKDYSFGQYMLGNIGGRKKDWPTAEAALTRAIELHDQGDPLPGGDSMLWGAQDGLGIALGVQRKFEAAVTVLETAQALAVKLGTPDAIGKTEYNLACVYAELGRFDESLKTLEHCISVKPSTKNDAAKDSSFVKARERDDFKKLLSGE